MIWDRIINANFFNTLGRRSDILMSRCVASREPWLFVFFLWHRKKLKMYFAIIANNDFPRLPSNKIQENEILVYVPTGCTSCTRISEPIKLFVHHGADLKFYAVFTGIWKQFQYQPPLINILIRTRYYIKVNRHVNIASAPCHNIYQKHKKIRF